MNQNWITNLIKELGLFLKDLIFKPMPPQNPTPAPEPIIVPPVVIPPKILDTPLLPRQKLYLIALSCVGTDASPNDIAPDEYGCMETVDDIYFKTFKIFINGLKTGVTVSTNTGLKTFLAHPQRFKRTNQFLPGVIIICATGYSKISNTPIPNGHVGICGLNNIIYSNNSLTGRFDDHFDLETWTRRYVTNGGYDIYMFEPVGV